MCRSPDTDGILGGVVAEFDDDPEEDLAWVNRSLCGNVPEIQAMQIKALGVGEGEKAGLSVSIVYRLSLSYTGGQVGPSSIMLKHFNAHWQRGTKPLFEKLVIFAMPYDWEMVVRNEHIFYTSLAEEARELGVVVPRVFQALLHDCGDIGPVSHILFDDFTDSRQALFLEDLGTNMDHGKISFFGYPETHVTKKEARTFAALARLHARFWNSRSKEVLTPFPAGYKLFFFDTPIFQWHLLRVCRNPAYLDEIFDAKKGLAQFDHPNARALMEPSLREVVVWLLGVWPGIQERFLKLYHEQRTFVHGDFHQGNVGFCEDGSIALMDFQGTGQGCNMADIVMGFASFLWTGAGAKELVTAEDQRSTVHAYWACLTSHGRFTGLGPEQYPWERCWDEFQVCYLAYMGGLVGLLTMLGSKTLANVWDAQAGSALKKKLLCLTVMETFAFCAEHLKLLRDQNPTMELPTLDLKTPEWNANPCDDPAVAAAFSTQVKDVNVAQEWAQALSIRIPRMDTE